VHLDHKRIHFDILGLQPSPDTTTFPFLTELSISDPGDSASWLAFLANTDLPSLRSLGFYNWYRGLSDPLRSIADTSTRLGPHLIRFALTSAPGIAPLFDWSEFTSLHTLLLAVDSDLSTTLSRLPSRLRHLRLFASEEGMEAVFGMVRQWPEALSTLQTLSIPRENFTGPRTEWRSLAPHEACRWIIVGVPIGSHPIGMTGKIQCCILGELSDPFLSWIH
jgi:hypothetical protein